MWFLLPVPLPIAACLLCACQAMALPAGAACDLFSRKLILVCSAIGWSIATAASAMAATYGQLLAARVALGVAQATIRVRIRFRVRVTDNC